MNRGVFFAWSLLFSYQICAAVNSAPPDTVAVFGGAVADDVFQQRARVMPGFIENNMRGGQSFDKLLYDAADLRVDVADFLKHENSQDYKTRRFFENNQGFGSSLTPMCRYSLMMKTLLKNIKGLQKSSSFIPLDDQIEYRWRECSVLEWLGRKEKERTDMNQIDSFLMRIIHGPDGEKSDEDIPDHERGDKTMVFYDFENDWFIDTDGQRKLKIDNHHQKNLKEAFKKAKKGVDDPDIKIGHIEFKTKGKSISLKGYMYAVDGASRRDYGNVPFALLHPSSRAVPYYFGLAAEAFESARYCEGGRDEKIRAIFNYFYIAANGMLLVRGSASINEWFLKALFKFHGLGDVFINPISKLDELAQSCFTFEQFLTYVMDEKKESEKNIPGYSLKEREELEAFYRQYFLSDKTKDVWQDFLSQPSGVTDVKRDEEIVISLTSYPERMFTTWFAIESLLRQTEKPDRIVLNLFEGEFPNRELPWTILEQVKRGLEINWSPINRKVFLKVIPTVQKYQNAAVVAFDDDIVYPTNRLSVLLDGYRKHPDCVIGQDVRVIPSVDGIVPPVMYWLLTGYSTPNEEMGPAFNLAPEGYQGILYPPHSLFDRFDDASLYERLCPTDDDIWMYTSVVAKGRMFFKPANQEAPLTFIEKAQQSSKTLGAINGQDNNHLYNVYMEHLTKEGLLQNAGLMAIEQDLAKFLMLSVTSIPKEISVSSLTHQTMFNAPVSFDKGFSVLLKDGIFLRGPVGSFRILAKKFTHPTFSIRMEGFPFLTEAQLLISYEIKKSEEVIKKGVIDKEHPFIELEDQVSEEVQSYDLLTTATQQNPNWMTFCVSRLVFN